MLKQLLSTLIILLTVTCTLGQVNLNQFIKRAGETPTGNASQNLFALTFIDSCRSQFTIDLSGCPNVTAGSTVDVELVAASTGGTYGAGQTIASGTYTYGQALSGAVTNDNNWNGSINSYLFGNITHGDNLVFDKFGWDQAGSGADTIGVTFRVKINDPACCVNNTWGELTINNNSICAQILAGDSTGALALADCDGGGESNLIECQLGSNPLNNFDDTLLCCASAVMPLVSVDWKTSNVQIRNASYGPFGIMLTNYTMMIDSVIQTSTSTTMTTTSSFEQFVDTYPPFTNTGYNLDPYITVEQNYTFSNGCNGYTKYYVGSTNNANVDCIPQPLSLTTTQSSCLDSVIIKFRTRFWMQDTSCTINIGTISLSDGQVHDFTGLPVTGGLTTTQTTSFTVVNEQATYIIEQRGILSDGREIIYQADVKVGCQ